jgi:23S rRNA (cytosine1962-C5)-methyltransferase
MVTKTDLPKPSGSGPVVLRPGKDKPVRARHHWIYSGAVARLPEFEDGDILAVVSSAGEHLGYGYFNKRCSILGRMLSFDRTPGPEAVALSLGRALALRERFFDAGTNACRLVNAEGDGLPGLIVDRYGDVLVLQVGTLGMERLKLAVIRELGRGKAAAAIYERSNQASRREEGLPEREGLVEGRLPDEVRVLESGFPFLVDIMRGQKTGLFLDQRENRRLVQALAGGRRVLNCFAYTGGFSVYALRGGAARALSVEVSESALDLARRNVELNGFFPRPEDFVRADVFEFLRGETSDVFDFIILDPPAFAKKRGDVVPACRGYKDLNRLALSRLPAGGLLLTFSCSHFVEESLFRTVLFQAALESGRRVRILDRHHQAFDHPLNIFHPESEYLKGYLLCVD